MVGFVWGVAVMVLIIYIVLGIHLKILVKNSKEENPTHIGGKFYYVIEETEYNRKNNTNQGEVSCDHRWVYVQTVVREMGYLEDHEIMHQFFCIRCDEEKVVDEERALFLQRKQKIIDKKELSK